MNKVFCSTHTKWISTVALNDVLYSRQENKRFLTSKYSCGTFKN